ncbi:MAG: DUF4105 domain-containing protein [Bacteroidales bacterium]
MKSINLKFYLLLFFLFFLNSNYLQAKEQPRISLLTCDSGDELYSTFGHSALRVNYPELDKDIVFNFGLFDFSTPHFYLKFIRGKLKYMLGIQYMDDFMEQFKWEGRSVKEQNLNLTEDQSKELLERLAFLYLPQNRYYYYSFLYKNCTSELRDIIFPLVEQSQELYEAESAGFTYRELLNNYIKGWTKFGINLILGSSLDKPANKYESMFLPENLYNGIAILKNGDLSIVSEDVYLYRAVEKEKRFSFAEIILSPLVVFLLLFAIMVFLVARSYTTRAKRRYNFYSNLYLGLLSILGLILTIIILITEHTELYSNYNLLWCNPLFLLVVLASLKRWKKAERLFSAISLIFLSLLQFVWACNIQYAEPGFIPIIITLALLFITRIIFSKA